jgi:hypothetical protein
MGEMTPLLAQSVRRGLVAAALFAGLALTPCASFGAKDQRKDDRDTKQQDAARGTQAAPPSATVARPGERKQGDQASPAARTQPQQQPAAPQIRAGQPQQRTPVGGWRNQQVAPRSDNSGQARGYTTPDAGRGAPSYGRSRQGTVPDQNQQYTPRSEKAADDRWGSQQGNSYQYQPRVRRESQPQVTSNADNSYQRQPRANRGSQSGSDPYQMYRSPKKVAAPQRDDSGSSAYDQPQIRRSQPARGDASQSDQDVQGRQRGSVAKSGADQSLPWGTSRGSAPQDMPKITRPGSTGRPQSGNGGAAVKPAAPRPAVPRGERKFAVPEARFRGPNNDGQVRVVPKDSPTRLQVRMRDSIRRENRQLGNWNPKATPSRDVVGNWVPKDTIVFNRTNVVNTNITINYTNIVNNFGTPGFGFLVAPRFFDIGGGVVFGGRHHHTLIFVNFFYPYYFSDPFFTGFWYDGYYPSVYTYFGWCPGWVYPTRVYYVPTEYYYYPPATPYRYYSGYSLDSRGVDRAIDDIRRSWTSSDIGPLSAHLTDELDIRVYFDGEYSYTTTTDDFYQMTLDTLTTTQTTEMDFDEPIWISSHEVFVTGSQAFYDPDGDRHALYLSFRLRQLGSGWYLVAIGTSKEPIQHEYRDFRYQ